MEELPKFSEVEDDNVFDEFRCSICLEHVVDPVRIRCCKNYFCRACLQPCKKCPLCSVGVVLNKTIDRKMLNILATLKVKCIACGQHVVRGVKCEVFAKHECVSGTSDSIQGFLGTGDLGSLLEKLDEIRECISEYDIKLEFPTIVCCGQESSGKSSVLERISMLPLFPRSDRTTTRVPLRLRLHHMTETELKAQAKIMELPFNPISLYVELAGKHFKVEPDKECDLQAHVLDAQAKLLNGESFSSDPIVVKVWSTCTPNLELVDLPGVYNASIAGETDDMALLAKSVTEDYLKKEAALVVVVVPATIDRVRNDQVIGMIQRAKKEALTICALTKSDQAGRPEYNRKDPFGDLKSRARGQADDCPKLGGGYVLLRNRDTRTDQLSLKVAASFEKTWFRENMPDLVREGRASADCLIRIMGNMMQSYTLSSWAPDALVKLKAYDDILQSRLTLLGDHPSTISCEMAAVRVTKLWNAVDLGPLVEQIANSCAFRSPPSKEARQEAERYFHNAFASADMVDSFMQPCVADEEMPLRLCRFPEFLAEIRDSLTFSLLSGISNARERWKLEFPTMVTLVTIDERLSFEGAAKRLFKAIFLEEICVVAPKVPKKLGRESFESERKKLNKAREAVKVAETLISSMTLKK